MISFSRQVSTTAGRGGRPQRPQRDRNDRNTLKIQTRRDARDNLPWYTFIQMYIHKCVSMCVFERVFVCVFPQPPPLHSRSYRALWMRPVTKNQDVKIAINAWAICSKRHPTPQSMKQTHAMYNINRRHNFHIHPSLLRSLATVNDNLDQIYHTTLHISNKSGGGVCDTTPDTGVSGQQCQEHVKQHPARGDNFPPDIAPCPPLST